MYLFNRSVLFFVIFIFFWIATGFTQAENEILISEKLYNRTINALQNYVNDEVSYFEGYMLCTRFPEKMKLLESIDRTVEIIDTFSEKEDLKDDTEINYWKSQAHFYNGIALGLLGEKVTADFELSLAQKYFLDDSSGWNKVLKSRIEIGVAKNKLQKYEELYLNHIDDLAPVQIVIDEDKYAEIGNALGIRQIELGTVSYPELIPHVIAYSEDKLTNVVLRGATITKLYLPRGKYQIYNINKSKLLSEFKVKTVDQQKIVKLPQQKVRYGFYFLIFSSAIAAVISL